MAQPDTKNAGPADDLVLAFRTVKSRAQGRIVRLGAAANDILSAHAYPEPVTELLGEALALTAMLGSLVRANGRLILQTKSDGPVGMLAVHYRAPGHLRGLATFDATRLGPPRERRDGRPGRIGQGHLLGTGHLALTIDPGGNEPRTQGIVAIANHSLAQAAHTYFRQSEQIPTFVRLAVARQSVRGGGWHWRAGGLILQQLPEDVGAGEEPGGDAQEDWQRARMLAQTVEDHELLDPTLPPDRLLYRLFAEEGVRTVPPVQVEANCGCTRERVEALLKGFGKDELEDMREADGSVGVTCEYCTTRYTFSPDEVSAL
jgi:molecular chaperone Hsp33